MEATRRDVTLDIARGLAMVGVVVGHVLRGLFAAGIANPAHAWAANLDRILYLMHLPMFALATGLLMPRSVDRQGRGRYLVGRLWLLVYVFLVWTLIQGSVEVVTSPWKNTPVTWGRVLVLWQPLGHLWFMPLLMLATTVVVGSAPWRTPWRAAVGWGAALASLGFWGFDGPVAFTKGLSLIAFFLVGAWLTHARLQRLTAPTSLPFLAAVTTVAGAAWIALGVFPSTVPPTYDEPGRQIVGVVLGVAGAACAVVALLAASTILARAPRGSGWLGLIGRVSLQVYLAHIVFTAGTRILLARLGLGDPLVHLVAGTLLGILGALMVERVTRRLPWLFTPPVGVGRSLG